MCLRFLSSREMPFSRKSQRDFLVSQDVFSLKSPFLESHHFGHSVPRLHAPTPPRGTRTSPRVPPTTAPPAAMAAFVNAIHPRDASVRSLGEPSSVEETRASLETRAKHAVASSPAHRVLVLRAVDECRGALETEGRQMAYLPNDLAVRLTEVQDMRACLVEGLVRNSLVWERSVSCTSR